MLPWAAIISLCVHSFLESMPLADGAGFEHHVHAMGHVFVYPTMSINPPLFTGLTLHKLLIALVLMVLVKSMGTNILTRWGILIMFGLIASRNVGVRLNSKIIN